jgi:hypothetical protein
MPVLNAVGCRAAWTTGDYLPYPVNWTVDFLQGTQIIGGDLKTRRNPTPKIREAALKPGGLPWAPFAALQQY